MADMYQRKFSDSGFEVVLATGEQSLVISQKEKIDIVLYNLALPNEKEFELIEKIRSSSFYPNMKIIVMSNIDKHRNYEDIIELGADDFIIESDFTPAELVLEIMRITGQNPQMATGQKNDIGVLFVVRDPKSIESMLKDFLIEGFIAVATDNAYDAQQYVMGGESKIVLLDVALRDNEGGNKGLGILKLMKSYEETKNIPVIIFSENIEEETKNQAIKLGALDLNISPNGTPKQISDQIRKIIE